MFGADSVQTPEPITLEVAGSVPAAEQRYALDKIRWLALQAPTRVDRVHLTIISWSDPGAAHRVRVRASLDVDGRILRSTSDGESVYEAVDVLRHRTCLQLARVRSRTRGRTSRPV
ncbi:MAG TPA: hypothetical protein VFU73_07285 [Actinocrinis sp.]|nr:hypothetical protein [Actinocrinis sp.]